ncbi:N-acetyltransferase [Haloechinothrix sp. LS1_15]|uniref:GNAT family N-acetyltransferase n=1 Tax=Haloechinothrix sp. LS1_15 TaxID=2652248 RepID=UPI002944A05D|nr:N-acetyltransferase [Haloechinothrix sp. LS1_15]MDV6011304.1 N-acetyltransferase [Haloechinothrix sp. LS1_15]
MFVRREIAGDAVAIREVHASAFAVPGRDSDPGEVWLVDTLRGSDAWIPELSLVAVECGEVTGHVLGSRAEVGDLRAIGLGPLGVRSGSQRGGVGSALMHAVLGAADAMGEPLVGLLGDHGYYRRFGFAPAGEFGIDAPDPTFGDHFQVRALTTYDPSTRGVFRYASPFMRLS